MFEIMSQWGEYELREIADAQKEHQYAECQKRRLKVVLKQSCYLTAWKMLHKRQLRFIIADSGHCSTLVKVERWNS